MADGSCAIPIGLSPVGLADGPEGYPIKETITMATIDSVNFTARPTAPANNPAPAPASRQGVSVSALKDEIATLQTEIARLKAIKNAPRVLTMRVSEKRALSVYGLGRFPVTLYREQWERLLAAVNDLKQFISANASELATKGE